MILSRFPKFVTKKKGSSSTKRISKGLDYKLCNCRLKLSLTNPLYSQWKHILEKYATPATVSLKLCDRAPSNRSNCLRHVISHGMPNAMIYHVTYKCACHEKTALKL